MPPRPLPPPLVTLFTHPTCGLCANAKQALASAWEKRPFDFRESNVNAPEAEKNGWDVYRMDVPVVHVQWDKESEKKVLMHRIEESEILRLIKEVEEEKKASKLSQ